MQLDAIATYGLVSTHTRCVDTSSTLLKVSQLLTHTTKMAFFDECVHIQTSFVNARTTPSERKEEKKDLTRFKSVSF